MSLPLASYTCTPETTAMRLEALLRAHSFMKTEQPPELWEPDTDDDKFIPLLGEMIAAGLATGTPLEELTLSASNVIVEPPVDEEPAAEPAPGEYVAITVRGVTDYGPDDRWPGADKRGLLHRLHDRLVLAGIAFAYIRKLSTEGSMTVFLRRRLPQQGTSG